MAALFATVYASVLSLVSLDLIEHEASGAELGQHIWPEFEIRTVANFQAPKFTAVK